MEKLFETILRNNVSWHFKVASCKRIIVLKRPRIIEVRGVPFYTVEVNAFKSLTKKGFNFNLINLPNYYSQIKINPKKIKDVEKLLNSHYGVDWRQDQNLEFYNKIIPNEEIDGIDSDQDRESEENNELCCGEDGSSDVDDVDVRIQ